MPKLKPPFARLRWGSRINMRLGADAHDECRLLAAGVCFARRVAGWGWESGKQSQAVLFCWMDGIRSGGVRASQLLVRQGDSTPWPSGVRLWFVCEGVCVLCLFFLGGVLVPCLRASWRAAL